LITIVVASDVGAIGGGVLGIGVGVGVGIAGIWMGEMVLIAQWMPLGATNGRHSIVAHLNFGHFLPLLIYLLISFLFLFVFCTNSFNNNSLTH